MEALATTTTRPAVSTRKAASTKLALWVGQADFPGATAFIHRRGHPVEVRPIHPALFDRVLRDPRLEAGAELTCVVIAAESPEAALTVAETLRSHSALDRVRAYVVGVGELEEQRRETLDIEDVLPGSPSSAEARELVERGVGAWSAIGANPLLPKYYLDASYNDLFDWFENTRWDWKDIDLTKIEKDRLTEVELSILKESAIIEFGTLPGAHNFLREWSDEYSFSSWVLSWGAEEARHSLVQSRYLRALGVETMAKHAMYKREPYPIGHNRASTLMMNVISEARAAEYYRGLASLTQEPVLKKIWELLSYDEARHCRAFSLFCQELCAVEQANTVAAIEMAYVYLADRQEGVKHPAGYFYPHSTSTKGLREAERMLHETGAGATDRADGRVYSVIRKITGDQSVRDLRGLRAKLRELM